MPKGLQGQKPSKSKNLSRKKPEVLDARVLMQEATQREVGDTADKITRAPKKRKKLP
jgi:hypothetical protein